MNKDPNKSCLAPDPNPVKPKIVLPPGACDAHCHVFGPAARFPYAPDRSYTPPDAPVEQLRRLHAHLGISRAVIVHASCHGSDMAVTLDAIASSGNLYRGVAVVEDAVTDEELQRLHDGGIRGIRFNFVKHLGGLPDLKVFYRLLARIKPLGWHIVLHFDAKDLPSYAELLDRMPCPFVIDHMARVPTSAGLDQAPFRALLDVMNDERAWVKISGAERLTADGPPPYDDVVPFAQALIAAAPERILWGTDWPHPNVRHMPDDGDLVDLLAAFAPDEATRNRILVTNPERLYDFS